MSRFDEIFKQNIINILENGTRYQSRAKWEDGKNANCIKLFGLTNEYDLSNLNEVPVTTIRKLNYKNCIDELLWIWQRKSNNIKDLNSHIWDSWADSNGSIGSAYGFQVQSKLRKVLDKNGYPLYLDQIDYVIHELKFNPFSRRIVTNLFDIENLSTMGLEPCCYNCTWNVTIDYDGNKVLNLLLNQRSQDMLTANCWNVFQYSILLYMIAYSCGLKPGKLLHVIADAHIYDRHIDICKKIITISQKDSPTLKIQYPNNINPFYDFTVDSFELVNYEYNNKKYNIPIAV